MLCEIHCYISIVSIIIQTVVMLFGLFYMEPYVSCTDNLIIVSAGDILSMTLILRG